MKVAIVTRTQERVLGTTDQEYEDAIKEIIRLKEHTGRQFYICPPELVNIPLPRLGVCLV